MSRIYQTESGADSAALRLACELSPVLRATYIPGTRALRPADASHEPFGPAFVVRLANQGGDYEIVEVSGEEGIRELVRRGLLNRAAEHERREDDEAARLAELVRTGASTRIRERSEQTRVFHRSEAAKLRAQAMALEVFEQAQAAQ